MKSTTLLTFAAMAVSVLAQADPGPSPTESIGCEPHGDHWHCEAARPTGEVNTAAATATSSIDPGPSPTGSVGCEPHGDHWHCEGPKTDGVAAATSSAASAVTQTAHDHDDDHDHDHETGADTAKAGPSPTESVGCEPHGDHWHCAGPRVTSPAGTLVSTTPSSTSTLAAQSTGAAANIMVPVAGVLAAAAFIV